MKQTVILSGFEKYGTHAANSSELVVRALDWHPVAGYKIIGRLFPATIPPPGEDRGEDLFLEARRHEACGIIALGMGSDRKGLRIEREAQNLIKHDVYVPAPFNNKPIESELRTGSKLELDLLFWNTLAFSQKCAQAGIPVERDSRDAGGFCCNHLMWQMRRAQDRFRATRKLPIIYIHLPCSPECVAEPANFHAAGKVTTPLDQMKKGIEILLANSKLCNVGNS